MPNQYDRIIKENISITALSIIKKVLNIRDIELVELPTELHRTLEKKVDTLCKAHPHNGPPFLLLIEWQTWNDKRMAWRMLFYYCMLKSKYPDMEIVIYVIYIGRRKLNMSNGIKDANIQFSFRIVDFSELSPESFLASDIPEELLFAILAGNEKGEEKRPVVKKILIKLHQLLKDNPSLLNEKLIQLEILGGLKTIHNIIIEEENKMNITVRYRLSSDVRFIKGREDMAKELVRNLLLKSDFTSEKIADIINKPLKFVQAIKNEMA
jgi:hypothetical protein